MITKKVIVGGVVSPALLVQSACMYGCKMTLKMGEKTINAKSLLGMMSMTFIEGDEVEVIADGAEEQRAIEQMQRCFSDKSGKKAC